MTLPKISWADGYIVFDAVASEDVSESAQVTESPVEVGFAISDGVVPAAPGLTVGLYISDRPLTSGGSALAGSGMNARKQLRDLMFAGTVVNYYSDSETFENAAIGSLTYSRTGRPGEYELRLGLKRIATTETRWEVNPLTKTTKKPARKTTPNKDKIDAGKTDAKPGSIAFEWWLR